MKKYCLIIIFLFFCWSINSQTKENPFSIFIGTNFIDIFPTASNENNRFGKQGDLFEDFFNVEENWSYLPTVNSIGINRYINNNYTLGATFSFNTISKAKINGVLQDDLVYYSFDVFAKYSLSNVTKKNNILNPFLELGAGYSWWDNNGAGNLLGAVGMDIWFSRSIGLTIKTNYKYNFETFGARHFQHHAGFSFKFGGFDSDKDKIYDKNDKCPKVPGLKKFDGCPDTDNDGIEDEKDLCPEEPGSVEMNGCPDTDGDEIYDHIDECPEVAGLEEFNGCPDTDNDGVKDSEDKCPEEAGSIDNNGCPLEDKDNDGVIDSEDQCPDEVGTVANNGCPEKESISIDENSMKIITDSKMFFASSSSKILGGNNFRLVTDIMEILAKYPTINIIIEGFASEDGTTEYNQVLSEQRANAVRELLIQKGVDGERIKAVGVGEFKSDITDNSPEARARNRKVGFRIQK